MAARRRKVKTQQPPKVKVAEPTEVQTDRRRRGVREQGIQR